MLVFSEKPMADLRNQPREMPSSLPMLSSSIRGPAFRRPAKIVAESDELGATHTSDASLYFHCGDAFVYRQA